MTLRPPRPPARTPPASTSPRALDGYRLDDQIGFLLRKAHQRATETFNMVMSELDVTPMQLAALIKLDELGPVSQNQLGRLIAMDPATIFGVVGRLIKRGLVRQGPAAHDARLTLIELTAAGRALVAPLKQRGLEVSARTLAPLSAEEARTLLALLQRIG